MTELNYKSFLWMVVTACLALGCDAELGVGDDDTSDDDVADDDSADEGSNFALAFDSGSGGTTEETTAIGLESEFTIEFWFRRLGNFQGFILDARGPGDDFFRNWAVYQRDDEAEGLKFYCKTDDEDPSLVGPDMNEFDAGWHHVAILRTAEGLRAMYLDGEALVSEAAAACVVDSVEPLTIGNRSGGQIEGAVLDEIRISSFARYHTSFTPDIVFDADDDTTLLWHFDEGQGNLATDEMLGLEFALEDIEWVEASR